MSRKVQPLHGGLIVAMRLERALVAQLAEADDLGSSEAIPPRAGSTPAQGTFHLIGPSQNVNELFCAISYTLARGIVPLTLRRPDNLRCGGWRG